MFTDQEIKDIDTLHEVAIRNGQVQDGLDADLCKHIQDIQKILFIRSAGRDYGDCKAKVHGKDTSTNEAPGTPSGDTDDRKGLAKAGADHSDHVRID